MTQPTRTPYCTKIRYGVTGAPEIPIDVPNAPDVTLAPTLVEIRYLAARGEQPAFVDATVSGYWMRGGERWQPEKELLHHFKNGPDGWPAWLAAEARLHDPDGPTVPAPATDRECAASISGHCLAEGQSETACDTDAGECVHGGQPATDQTGPSHRAGLRDEIVNALGRIKTIPPVEHRRQQADHVLTLLYREWPWLRAEAEETATNQAALRERIAEAIIRSDGVPSQESVAKLHWAAALREADAVLAVLPATVDRAAVLDAAALHLYTALFPAVYADMGQKAAEGVQRAVSELRRMAAESAPADTGHDDSETAGEPVSPAYARLKAAAKKATEAAHLHAMHGMKRTFQLALNYGTTPIPAAEVLNALGLDQNANPVEPATPAAVPDPTWPRRAWDLGLLHKGGDPHHCPACLARSEPPKDFVCPGAEANAEVLANPQPAAAQQPGEARSCPGFPETCPNLRAALPEPGGYALAVRCGCFDMPKEPIQ